MKSKIDLTVIVAKVEQTLSDLNIPFTRIIEEFGQLDSSIQRKKGKRFSFSEHMKGVILALLSNSRVWKDIAPNIEKIDAIFQHYDWNYLINNDPEDFANKLMEINCGNRVIMAQMKALSSNIYTLQRIESDFGSLDNFVESEHTLDIAIKISKPGSKYKIIQLGFSLACEYLKNVGIETIKPDVHLTRITGPERLGIIASARNDFDVAYEMNSLTINQGINAIYLDNLLWLLCAEKYGELCTTKPECSPCKLSTICHYPKLKTM